MRPAVPASAVLQDTQGPYVWVLGADSKAERRSIARGELDGGFVFVEKGLEKGERVVADGAHKVRRGMSVEAAGPAAQEVVTVNTIRQRVEQEAMAAHNNRIAELEKEFKDKSAAQRELDKARKAGERMSQDEINAMRATETAMRALQRAKSVVHKVPDVRKSVEAEALDAAKADAQAGRDWSVDMNAPLTSLFDRQDVESKFRQREVLVTKIAETTVTLEELRASAVAYGKQYALPKA
jgi:hypothetical protein